MFSTFLLVFKIIGLKLLLVWKMQEFVSKTDSIVNL